jgi:hypothetical protein
MRAAGCSGWFGVLCGTAWLGIASAPSPAAEPMPFVERDPASVLQFRLRGTGEPFVAAGVNYFDPETGWAPQPWKRFDAKRVRRHLEQIRRGGFNAVRVFLTYESFHREAGRVSGGGEKVFRSFLAMCRELGMYVMAAGPDHWEGVPEYRRRGADDARGRSPAPGDAYADERLLKADEQWWAAMADRFADEPAILAWDLHNEPTIGWATAPMRRKWNTWLTERYGTVERVAEAWGRPADEVGRLGEVAVPPAEPSRGDRRLLDYQRFREHIAMEWTRRMTAAIRSADKNHMITIGHIQWAVPIILPRVDVYAGFDVRETARYLDFVTFHFYPLAAPRPCDGPEGLDVNAAYLAAVVARCEVDKPIFVGEFGWYGGGDVRVGDRVVMPPQTPDDQVAWCRRLLDVTRGRTAGWLNWAYADAPPATDLSRWSGCWTSDEQLKPWGRVFGDFARTMSKNPAKRRPCPAWLEAVPFDRDALVTDPAAGRAYLDSLRKAWETAKAGW